MVEVGIDKLVIVAGSGKFPFMVADGARLAGLEVCVLGIRGQASAGLQEVSDKFYWIPIARVGKWIKLSRRFGANKLIMAGAVRKSEAFSRWRIWRYLPDFLTLRIWFRRARSDRRNLALLSALAEELEEAGITVVNSVEYCEKSMAEEGVMTNRTPSAGVLADIEFGWPIAKEIARMDVGQSIAVREKDIIAVEAIEGTDEMIGRAGRLGRGRWSLLKVAQSHQDMRFDVPTVGPDTIEKLHQNKGSALVVESGKTIMVDKEIMIKLANRYGIAIIGRK